jgi:hypothetical protein
VTSAKRQRNCAEHEQAVGAAASAPGDVARQGIQPPQDRLGLAVRTGAAAVMLAILDRIMRQVAKRVAREAHHDDDAPATPDVLAQVQAEAAAT